MWTIVYKNKIGNDKLELDVFENTLQVALVTARHRLEHVVTADSDWEVVKIEKVG
jgi:hypothetical protein